MKKDKQAKITIGIIFSVMIFLSYAGSNSSTLLNSEYSNLDDAVSYGYFYAAINFLINFITISLIPFIMKFYNKEFFYNKSNLVFVINGIFWVFASMPLFSIIYRTEENAGLGIVGATIFSIISYCFLTAKKHETIEKNTEENMNTKESQAKVEKEIEQEHKQEETVKYCTNCGKKTENSWAFCNYCGFKLK